MLDTVLPSYNVAMIGFLVSTSDIIVGREAGPRKLNKWLYIAPNMNRLASVYRHSRETGSIDKPTSKVSF